MKIDEAPKAPVVGRGPVLGARKAGQNSNGAPNLPGNAPKKSWFWRSFRLFLLLSCLGALALAGNIVWLWRELPEVGILQDIHLQQPLRIYSSDGELIGEFGKKIRQPIELDRVPRHVINAFLASEDARFLEHSGVDFIGLGRAAVATLSTMSLSQGASTITMQVARNYFLNREKTLIRKLREILLAIKIERELSKQQILELYLNRIFFGHRAYGIDAAAQVYYGKSASELSIAEAAMLAGIPQRPSKDNPLLNPKRSLERRNNYVLPRMRELGMISAEELDAALNTPEAARFHSRQAFPSAAYFVEMVRIELDERYDDLFFESGYRVYTTLNSRYQSIAARALRQGVQDYELRQGYDGYVGQLEDYLEAGDSRPVPAVLSAIESEQPLADDLRLAAVIGHEEGLQLIVSNGNSYRIPAQDLAKVLKAAGKKADEIEDWLKPGAIVMAQLLEDGQVRLAQRPKAEAALYSLDPRNGAVRAMIGGYGRPGDHFNRAVQAQRQAGSLFKPFLYSVALANGYNASTVINDTNVSFDDATLEDDWRPSNYSNRVFGPTLLRNALVYSRNLVSIRLLEDLGIGKTRRWMRRFGFSTEKQVPNNLTMALGSGAFTPEQVSVGLSVFANGGHLVEPWYIERIEDAEGQVIYRHDYAVACLPCLRNSQQSAEYEFADGSGEADEAAGEPDRSMAGSASDADAGMEQSSAAGADQADEPDGARADGELAVSKIKLLNSREEIYLQLEEIEDPGNIKHRISQAENTLDERIALIVGSMMKDVMIRGTAARAYRALKRVDIYGKTGTTNDNRDVWFSGFHPQLLTTVWIGRDDNGSIGRREAGGKTALPIWIEYMRSILPELGIQQLPLTDGVQLVRVNRDTGEITTAADVDSYFEYFLSENLPKAEEENGSDGGEGRQQQSDALKELF